MENKAPCILILTVEVTDIHVYILRVLNLSIQLKILNFCGKRDSRSLV
jgi:hypothetical protein